MKQMAQLMFRLFIFLLGPVHLQYLLPNVKAEIVYRPSLPAIFIVKWGVNVIPDMDLMTLVLHWGW